MFGWFGQKPKRRLYPGSATLGKDSVDVVSEYGAILEKHEAMSICDASALPQPKDQMKLALKTVLKRTTDRNLRSAFEVAFVSLADFQDGVGPTPFRFALPDPSNISKEAIAENSMYLKLMAKVEEERAQLSTELDAFISAQAAAEQ